MDKLQCFCWVPLWKPHVFWLAPQKQIFDSLPVSDYTYTMKAQSFFKSLLAAGKSVFVNVIYSIFCRFGIKGKIDLTVEVKVSSLKTSFAYNVQWSNPNFGTWSFQYLKRGVQWCFNETSKTAIKNFTLILHRWSDCKVQQMSNHGDYSIRLISLWKLRPKAVAVTNDMFATWSNTNIPCRKCWDVIVEMEG